MNPDPNPDPSPNPDSNPTPNPNPNPTPTPHPTPHPTPLTPHQGVARELVSLLQEAQQQCPEWLAKLAAESGGQHGRGYGGRGGKFGGRDYRANAQMRQYR